MITIRDVARQAGVSVATVSRVLNNSALVSPDTRDVVMKAVTQLGYRPNANAQALATQVSDTIGVVVMDVSDAFFGALVKAVDTGCSAASEICADRQQLSRGGKRASRHRGADPSALLGADRPFESAER